MTILMRADRVQETLTRHKPMVAQWLDANYDRVSDTCSFLNATLVLVLSAAHLTVLRHVQHPHPLIQLRDQEAVAQASRGDPPRPRKLRDHDALHRQRRESQDDDELFAGQEQEHPVRGVPCVQGGSLGERRLVFRCR